MAEQQQATPQAPATPEVSTTTEPQASPLEKVYKDFNIEDTASQFQQPQTPQAPAQPVQTKVPDPFDPNFPNFIQQTAQSVQALTQTLSQTKGELTAMQHQLVREKTEADIQKAASSIAEQAGIKPKVAAVALELKAREDPKFLAIWNNRHKNPAAWAAAQKALALETQQEYAVRQDPQVAENVRAAKTSQQQMATTQAKSDNDKWLDMSPADRQREVQRLLRLGGR